MNTEQERAEFEAWVKSLPRGRRYCLITYEHEGRRYYDDTYTSIAFEAFIAGRAALQSQAQPKDLMLAGVLRMPFEMAMADWLSRRQFYQRAQQALNELEALQDECEKLRKDAERYRYLSSMATQQADHLGPIFRIDVRRTPQTLFNFDAAVDHARRIES